MILNKRTGRVSWLAVAIPVIAFLAIRSVPTEPRTDENRAQSVTPRSSEPWAWLPAEWTEPAKD